jgi:hypothetical protein
MDSCLEFWTLKVATLAGMAKHADKSKPEHTFLQRLETAKAGKYARLPSENDRQAFVRYVTARAKEIGIPNPVAVRQNLTNWFTKGAEPSALNYVYLAEIFKVSVTWLISERGNMIRGYRLTPDQSEVIEIYNKLHEADEADEWMSQGRTYMRLVTQSGKHDPLAKRKYK